MNKNVIIAIVAIVLLGAIGFMVMSNRNNSSSVTTPTPTQSTPTTSQDAVTTTPIPSDAMEKTASQNVKEITVEGSNFKFSPAEMKVKKGDTVKITFKNTGGNHDFTIDEFNVATKQLKDGEEETVEFIADKTGTFEYYCSVGQHRQMGMKGNLIVE